MGIVYKITNKVNKKSYIGITTRTVEIRWKEHINDSKVYTNRPLYRAFNKYGLDSFILEVLEEVPDFLLHKKEIMCIKIFNTYKNGYNATLGGDGCTLIDHYSIYRWYKNNKNKTIRATAKHFDVDFNTVKTALIMYKYTDDRCSITLGHDLLRIPVEQFDKKGNKLAVYKDARQASLAVIGSDQGNSHIRQCCIGKRKTAYGFVWKNA